VLAGKGQADIILVFSDNLIDSVAHRDIAALFSANKQHSISANRGKELEILISAKYPAL
jgi:hypothetical protein